MSAMDSETIRNRLARKNRMGILWGAVSRTLFVLAGVLIS